MSLQLHRPDGKGGIEPRPARHVDWRTDLTSQRWGSGLRGGRLPRLRNPEMNPTPIALAVGFWLGLGAVTFVLLLAGYGTGFWH